MRRRKRARTTLGRGESGVVVTEAGPGAEDVDPHQETPGADDRSIRAAALDPAVAALLDAADQGDFADISDYSDAAPVRPSDLVDRPRALREDAHASSLNMSVRPIGPNDSDVAPLDPNHAEFQTVIRQSIVEAIRVHGGENPGIEVCGVLVGTVYENPQASFVYIDSMIRGEASSARSTQVTFTSETWEHIHKTMEEKHPGKKIIGWYHTHPGFGIFLSEMDLFIQRHFFNAPWQIAFVYDPHSRDSGTFAWRQGQTRRVDFVIDDETSGKLPEASLPVLSPMSASASFHEEPAAPVNAATLEELADRIRTLEGRVKWMLAGFAFLALVAIIWPLVVLVIMPQHSSAGSPAGQTPAPANPDNDAPLLPLKSR